MKLFLLGCSALTLQYVASFQVWQNQRPPISTTRYLELHSSDRWDISVAPFVVSVAALSVVAFEPAYGASADYGIFAGRTASLMHPVTNFALFGTTLYSAYLGLQWRRLRYIGEEIKALNSQLPLLSSGRAKFPVSGAIQGIQKDIERLRGESEGGTKVAALERDLDLLNSAESLDKELARLTDTRKALQAGNLKDKHHLTGSILLGAGVTVSVLGAFNTYMRAGKLFPGPHLYGGMAITILWAVAASMVPAMQKGNDGARLVHICANFLNVALFAAQIPSGVEIMLKVLQNTQW